MAVRSAMDNTGKGSKFEYLKWFDAHLDLAYLAECGRDMDAPIERCGGPDLPAAVTLRSLCEGRVAACLGTIFTEADGSDAVGYPAGNAEAAHACGVRQLGWYRRWWADSKAGRKGSRDRGIEGSSEEQTRILILMECADPIRSVSELDWWVERGVVAIGLAWARGSRFAGGNLNSGVGLNADGRSLLARMEESGVVHDLAHLSQRATEESLALPGRVIASHSNCRALLGGENERHVTDETIRAIAGRGGVIGLNLFGKFLRPEMKPGERATIDDAVRHVEHVVQQVGHTRSVGLGSDMDGGLSALMLPDEIDSPGDLWRLAEALSARGWSNTDVELFAWGNWARFWGLT